MKYLDLISDKIDYLFRRGKNAEDRCYDFFIRTVTFLLITLIILCYGSFVHADDSLPIAYGVDLSQLNNYSWWSFNDTDSQYFADLYYGEGVVDGYAIPESSNDWVNNVPYFSQFDYANKYVICSICSYPGNSWVVVSTFDKSLIDDGHIIFLANNGFNYISDGNYSFTEYTINTSLQIYDTNTISINQGKSSWNMGGYNNSMFFANIPLYAGNQTVEGYNILKENDFEDDLDNLYNINYFCYPDLDLCSTAHLSNGGNSNSQPDVESNSNHNYLNDIQIGLTSQNIRQNILSSQVIIGCDVDDWILNNLDDYSMYINYKIYIKDSYQSSPNDPEFNYSVILPLRTFYNNAYTYSVAELFRNCTNSSNQTFQSYFNIVGEGQKVLSEQPYNAIIPCFLETIYQGLGKYYVVPDPQYQTIPYTIFQFKLDVSCSLTYQGMSVDDASGIYLKEFDFKNGSESVKVADILRNDNPWEGESEPQQSPIVPSAGGSPSGNGGSGSVNVNVDVSGQKIPIGVKTKQEIQVILDNYKDVNDTFMDSWEDLSDPNNDNNFMSFISDETKELPAVDYMIKGACAIFGLSIILFVLKVLLF